MKWAGMKYKTDLVLISRDKCFFSLSIAKLRWLLHRMNLWLRKKKNFMEVDMYNISMRII